MAERGCALGNQDACCLKLSYLYDSEESGGSAAAACEGWGALCRQGHARSCSFYASCLLYEERFPRDVEEGLRLLETGCAGGERVACRGEALVHERGTFAPLDPAAAFRKMTLACNADDPLACAHLGGYWERGFGTNRDEERAMALYRFACARGVRGVACEALDRLGAPRPAAARQ